MVDLKEQLATLESRLLNELYDLKFMIRNLLPNNFDQHHHRDQNFFNHRQDNFVPNYNSQYQPQPQEQQRQTYYGNDHQERFYHSSTRFMAREESTTTKTRPETSTHQFVPARSNLKQPEVVNVMKNKLKSLETVKKVSTKKVSVTTTEAPLTTTQEPTTTTEKATTSEPTKNEYTYYWKLENFPKVFTYAKKNEVFSHVFNVKGLFLRIRAVMRHLDDQNLAIDIEHLANIDEGDQMGVEISDGLVFKEIVDEKLFQYSFSIMDQTRPNRDLISPIYSNTDSDNFIVPNSLHLLANYIKNDSLLIKLIISF